MSTEEKVDFQTLWDGHPENQGIHEPCLDDDGYSAFGNQCAIRMGVALKAAGITVPKRSSSAKKNPVQCWTSGHGGKQHILRAQELAVWIATQPKSFGKVEKKVGKDHASDGVTASEYSGRTGIVFFMDFWHRSGETNPTGDHIDVWDGTNQAAGSDDYFARSKQVWFWELA